MLFGIGFTGALAGAIPAKSPFPARVSWGETRYSPSFRMPANREIVLIYIGSAGCVPSNRPDLPSVVERLKLRVQAKALQSGKSFAAMGIARDWNPADGLGHLRKFGEFDEVTTGRNWLNTGVRKYVWEDIPGEAATPQVLIVERVSGGENGEGRLSRYTVREEVLLARKIGDVELRTWLRQGVPIPGLGSSFRGREAER